MADRRWRVSRTMEGYHYRGRGASRSEGGRLTYGWGTNKCEEGNAMEETSSGWGEGNISDISRRSVGGVEAERGN